jgi:hypothetical protein
MKRPTLDNDVTRAMLRGSEPAAAVPPLPPSVEDGEPSKRHNVTTSQRSKPARKAAEPDGDGSRRIMKSVYLEPEDVALLDAEVRRRKEANGWKDIKGVDASALIREAIRKTFGRR